MNPFFAQSNRRWLPDEPRRDLVRSDASSPLWFGASSGPLSVQDITYKERQTEICISKTIVIPHDSYMAMRTWLSADASSTAREPRRASKPRKISLVQNTEAARLSSPHIKVGWRNAGPCPVAGRGSVTTPSVTKLHHTTIPFKGSQPTPAQH